MVHIIVGDNCSGKTNYLYKKYVECINNRKSVVTNFTENKLYPISNNSLYWIKKKAVIKNIYNTSTMTIVENDSFYTPEFYNIIKLLSYDVDVILLDSPDMKLTEGDLCTLVDVLCVLAEDIEVWITTHSSAYISIGEHTMYTIKDGELVEDDTLYEILL